MNKRIEEALQVLYEEGLKHLKPEYQEGADRYECIGRAIADTESSGIDFAKIAYSALEDWNYHDACAVLDWIFPKMHRMSADSPAEDYLDTLHRLKRQIDRPSVTVFTKWNNEKSDYDIVRYRVTVNIEELKP